MQGVVVAVRKKMDWDSSIGEVLGMGKDGGSAIEKDWQDSSLPYKIGMMSSPPVHVMMGATASGKSAYALRLAQRTGGVIINADSQQVYARVPILTAQPSAAEKAAIEHRLYGQWPLEEAMSVAIWRSQALLALEEVCSKGQTAIVVGGTGLYVQALLHGLSPIPDVLPEVRQEACQLETAAAFAALQQEDPHMASRLHAHDRQRVLRALEVVRSSGVSLGWWQQQRGEALPYPVYKTLLLPPRAALYERIHQRLEQMLEQGVLDEVAALQKVTLNPSAMKIVGLRELQAYGRGEIPLAAALSQAQQSTRHYAKRQMTWFRHQIQADKVIDGFG
jgi:tRNA dimethylallyltransferase